MKKILIALLTILSLTSCASGKCQKIHWFSRRMCYDVLSWRKEDNVYKIKFQNYGIVYIPVEDVMIVTDKCPICDNY